MKRSPSTLVLLCALAALAGGSVVAQGQERHEVRAQERLRIREARQARRALALDQRYHLDHYYPVRGEVVDVLPAGVVSVGYRGGNYYFHGGVWFQPLGGRFVVTAPPLGILAPTLPPAYATLWIAGTPYYYANGVYYVATPGQGYTVVAPPPGADAAQPLPNTPAPKAPPDPIFYPRSGQTRAQTLTDRAECERWAMAQPSAASDPVVFQRASSACMEGRGYTAR